MINSITKVSEKNDLDWLEAFPELATIKDSGWRTAISYARYLSLPAETVLLNRSEQCENFLFLLEGSIRITAISEMGREIVLYHLEPGDICSLTLTSLLKDNHFPAEAVTGSRIKGMALPMRYFRDALRESDTFREYVLSSVAKRTCEMMMLAQEVVFKRLDVRMAWRLYKLFKKHHFSPIDIKHKDIAKEIGTTREVASRMLKNLENQKLILLSRGKIELVSIEGLLLLANSY